MFKNVYLGAVLFIHLQSGNGTKYSKIDQVKFVEDRRISLMLADRPQILLGPDTIKTFSQEIIKLFGYILFLYVLKLTLFFMLGKIILIKIMIISTTVTTYI